MNPEWEYEVDPMPEGYEPTLSGSIPVKLIGNPNPTGRLYAFAVGPYRFTSDDEMSTIERKPSQQPVVAVSYREDHRAKMIQHLHYIMQTEGLYE